MPVPEPTGVDFAARLTTWQQHAGRHHLPWQGTGDPYRVWLSEIMLQQTQVATVLGYYPRFLQRFPDVAALAHAPLDDVLALWSGLGYYSRARNLHRCAQAVVQVHGGRFPTTAAVLAQLPGIGPSTAAAIASFCFGQRVSIFDGNVQRVMARHLGFAQDLSGTAARRELQRLAEQRVPGPEQEGLMPAYTQGLMDLGATVCTPRQPRCADCPVASDCVALAHGQQLALPVKSRKLVRRTRLWWWLVPVTADGRVWLVRRPSRGVWAGLHTFPSFDTEAELRGAWPDAFQAGVETWPAFTHVLTHLDLVIHPWVLRLPDAAALPSGLAPDSGRWVQGAAEASVLGLPTPVARVLGQLWPG